MYHTITPTDETRRWILRGLAIGVIGIVAGAGSPAQARAQSDSQCPNVEVVFARGTFEAPGVGDTGQAFVEALTSRLGGKSSMSTRWITLPRWTFKKPHRASSMPATRSNRLSLLARTPRSSSEATRRGLLSLVTPPATHYPLGTSCLSASPDPCLRPSRRTSSLSPCSESHRTGFSISSTTALHP